MLTANILPFAPSLDPMQSAGVQVDGEASPDGSAGEFSAILALWLGNMLTSQDTLTKTPNNPLEAPVGTRDTAKTTLSLLASPAHDTLIEVSATNSPSAIGSPTPTGIDVPLVAPTITALRTALADNDLLSTQVAVSSPMEPIDQTLPTVEHHESIQEIENAVAQPGTAPVDEFAVPHTDPKAATRFSEHPQDSKSAGPCEPLAPTHHSSAQQEASAVTAKSQETEKQPAPSTPVSPTATPWTLAQTSPQTLRLEPTIPHRSIRTESRVDDVGSPKLQPAFETMTSLSAPLASEELDRLIPKTPLVADVEHDDSEEEIESPRFETSVPVHQADLSPKESATSKRVSEASPAEQIRDAVDRQMPEVQQTGRAEVQLTLEPPELGRVQIVLRARDGQVNLDLIAHDSTTCTVLEQQLDSLRQKLTDIGVSLGSFSVAQEHAGKNFQQEQQNNPTPNFDDDPHRTRLLRKARIAVAATSGEIRLHLLA